MARLESIHLESAADLIVLIVDLFAMPWFAAQTHLTVPVGDLSALQTREGFLQGQSRELAVVYPEYSVGGGVGARKDEAVVVFETVHVYPHG